MYKYAKNMSILSDVYTLILRKFHVANMATIVNPKTSVYTKYISLITTADNVYGDHYIYCYYTYQFLQS